MPHFSDFILEASAEPKNPQPGQFWIPNAGPSTGELHVWSPATGAWLNLYDNSVRKRERPSLWHRLLKKLGAK